MNQYLVKAQEIVNQLLATQGQAGFADVLITIVAAITMLVILSVIVSGRKTRVAGSADGGVRGKLERIEKLLNELKTERARMANETHNELVALKEQVEALQKKAS